MNIVKGLTILDGGNPMIQTITWPITDESEKLYINDVIDSGVWGYEGKYENLFNKSFSHYLNTKYGLLVANGTVSLELALKACNIGPGDEVIVPAATWIATASAVVSIGAKPIFVDIDPNTLTIDPKCIKEAINKKTKAIIPVHLYGNMADMDSLLEIAKQHQLYIIEDCAHSHGSEWKGKKAGSIGDIGSFSFQMAKLITSGEGGFVSTNNYELASKLYSLKNCGRKFDSNQMSILGNNYRITELQAALLKGQLEKHKQYSNMRYQNRIYLDSLLKEIKGCKPFPLQEQVNMNAQYRYAFKYDCKEFSGLSIGNFKKILESEGILVHSLYTPVYRHNLFPIITNIKKGDFLTHTEESIKNIVLLNHTMLLKRDTIEKIKQVIVLIKNNSDRLAKILN